MAPTRLALLTALALGFAALAGIAIGAVAWLRSCRLPRPRRPPGAAIWPVSPTPEGLARDTAVRPAAPAPPLQLTDQDGRPFDLASLRGRPVLVFFGYTHCPDVCPTNLADVRDALKLIDGEVGVVFVTIDPARDDAAAMKQYVDYYQAGYIGLTGTDDEIRAAAGAWGVSYARVESDSASGYAMAHTADTFLVDAEGRLRHRIWFGAGPEVIAARINGLATEALATPVAAAPTAPPVTAPPATPAPPTPAASARGRSAVAGDDGPRPTRIHRRPRRPEPDRGHRERPGQPRARAAGPTALFTFRSTDDPSLAPVEVQGSFIWVVRGGKAAYVAEMTLPRPGGYDATITLDGPGRPGRIGCLHDGRPRAEPHAADRGARPQRPHPDRRGRRRQPAADLERRLPRSALLRALGGRAPGGRPALRLHDLLAGLLPHHRLRTAPAAT